MDNIDTLLPFTCIVPLIYSAGAKKSTPVKSAEAEARNKAREEARRKLIAAKREAVREQFDSISYGRLLSGGQMGSSRG